LQIGKLQASHSCQCGNTQLLESLPTVPPPCPFWGLFCLAQAASTFKATVSQNHGWKTNHRKFADKTPCPFWGVYSLCLAQAASTFKAAVSQIRNREIEISEIKTQRLKISGYFNPLPAGKFFFRIILMKIGGMVHLGGKPIRLKYFCWETSHFRVIDDFFHVL
jgi:hypothetical protein